MSGSSSSSSSSVSSSSSSSSSEEEEEKRPQPGPRGDRSAAKSATAVKLTAFRGLEQVRAGTAELLLLKVPAQFDVKKLNGVRLKLPDHGVVGLGEHAVQRMDPEMLEHMVLLPAVSGDKIAGKALLFSAGGVEVLVGGGGGEVDRAAGRRAALEAVRPAARVQHKAMPLEKKLPIGAAERKGVERQEPVKEKMPKSAKKNKKEEGKKKEKKKRKKD